MSYSLRMPNLFGVDMKSLFATAMGGQLLPLTLRKRVAGAYSVSDPSAGPVYTETAYTCRGFIEVTNTATANGEIVRASTGDGMILLGTLPAGVQPEVDDTIDFVVPGTSFTATAHVVAPVTGDPAGVQMRFQTVS